MGNMLTPRPIVSAVIILLFPMCILAAADSRWEQWLEAQMLDCDTNLQQWQDMYDFLDELQRQKININQTTRDELLQLPFLSEQQVMDIMEYLHRYHTMKSLNELMLIESIDYDTRILLLDFLVVGEGAQPSFPSLQDLMKYGKGELSAYIQVPMYEREGDRTDYLGYKYKYWTRYTFDCSSWVKAGIVASQDAGEPFFSQSNPQGFDQYSAYLLMKRLGRVETLALGRYCLSAGMGLVANTGFTIGKTSALQNMGRQTNVINAHTSASESGYFQGAAASVRLSSRLVVSPYLSWRQYDATLNDDGTVSTLLYNGYHRKREEIDKKHNTSAVAAGVNVGYDLGDISLGATAVYTHLSRPLAPSASSVYRKIYPRGSDFTNIGIHYGWRHYPIILNGETATNERGAIATANSLSLTINQYLEIVGIQRFYSFRYNSLYASAFSEGGEVRNESGMYLGVNWSPRYGLTVSAYSDVAYFAWPRFGVSQSSYALDNQVSVQYKTDKWTFAARYRLHLKQKDVANARVAFQKDHRMRADVRWTDSRWTSRTQIDFANSVFTTSSFGYMLSQNIGCSFSHVSLYAGGKYFHTDDYNSRLYSYERSMPRTFSYPAYYGHGIRYSIMGEWKPTRRIVINIKLATTNYFDRAYISSGDRQIDHSSATDLELSLRWKTGRIR